MTERPPVLTRHDGAVVGALVVFLALVAAATLASAFQPTAAPPSASARVATGEPPPALARHIREGVLGGPTAVNPLFAATPADHALVALVFSGLVRLGPGQTLEPELATGWTTSDDGRTWTFQLRSDARWHDGEPVTARDVVFTVETLHDPGFTGPLGASWRDVTATEVDDRTVRFELETAIGGFLQAATLPILPAHVLDGVDAERLADHPFNEAPIGSGPFRLQSLDEKRAILVRAAAPEDPPPAPIRPSPSPASPSHDSAAPDPPAGRSPTGIDLHFYTDVDSLAKGFAADALDAVAGVSADDARRLAATADARLVRYPTSTLSAVVFNLRLARPEFRDPRVRIALLRGIDRSSLVAGAWRGQAALADAPIPRVSWAFDGTVSPMVEYDRRAATRGMSEAGWVASDGEWIPPDASEPFEFELLSPDLPTNPASFLAAATVVTDWQAMRLAVTHRPLPASQVVERLRAGEFAAALLDINVGLDPDLYPLLASSQATSRGLNVSGLADTELDELLEAARGPGSEKVRRKAYRALQVRLAERQYLLPIAFRDDLVVVRDTLEGRSPRQVSAAGDRYWDVLEWRLADDR